MLMIEPSNFQGYSSQRKANSGTRETIQISSIVIMRVIKPRFPTLVAHDYIKRLPRLSSRGLNNVPSVSTMALGDREFAWCGQVSRA